jgi:cysteine desulfurase
VKAESDRPIYLDYNATTPHDPEVIAAMLPYLEGQFGNPSSSHWYGVQTRKAMKARCQVAAFSLSARGDRLHQRRN